MFLKFEFQDDRSINVGAVGGRNLPFPIDDGSSLLQQLVATTQCRLCAVFDMASEGHLQ